MKSLYLYNSCHRFLKLDVNHPQENTLSHSKDMSELLPKKLCVNGPLAEEKSPVPTASRLTNSHICTVSTEICSLDLNYA